jgi:HK97 family phage major capsid protein
MNLDVRHARAAGFLLQQAQDELAAFREKPRTDDRYSLARAVQALVDGRPSRAEHEWAVSETLGRMTGQQLRTGNSILVPTHELVHYEELSPFGDNSFTRDLNVAAAGAGGYLAETSNKQVVDFLRGRSVVGRFGATVLPGLRGDVTLPKISAGASTTWLSNELTQAAEQTPTTAQVALTPKTTSAFVEFSRQLLVQSNASIVLGRHLSAALAAAVDAAALAGSGASGQPTGLLNTAGVNSITGTSIAWTGILDFIVNSGVANLDVTGFATTPAIYKLLASRVRLTGGSIPIIHDGLIDGRPALHSTSVPSASLFAGPWPELWIGEWGAVDVSFDPYTKFTSAIIGVRAMFSLDIAVRYPPAFSIASAIT